MGGIIQPGRGGGIHGRGVSPRCGQGGRFAELIPGLRRNFPGFKTAMFKGSFTTSGVTKDSTGAALAGCTVKLFDATRDTLITQTISDGSGAFSFANVAGVPVYILAFPPSGNAVAGLTVVFDPQQVP